MKNPRHKEKTLSKFDIMNLVIGSIIGWGSFILPGVSFLPNSGVINTAIGLAVGGVCIIIIQKAYQIMLRDHVGEGGEFSYTLDNMGKVHGFIVGWALSLCYLSMIPLNATAYVLILRKIFSSIILCGPMYTFQGHTVFFMDIIIASIPIIVFTIINLRGLSFSAKVQNIMGMSLIVIVIILFFIIFTKSDLIAFNNNYLSLSNISFSKTASVVAIIPFLFVGFDVVPQVSNDLKFSPSKAHKITIIAIIFGILIYNLLNIIAGLSYGPTEVTKIEWAVGSSVINKTGAIGFIVLLIALFSAVTGGINGFMISSSKLIGSLANHNLCPSFLAKKNKKGIYHNAIFFIACVSLIGPWVGRDVIILIVDMASVLAALAYSYVGFIGIKKSSTYTEKILCAVSLGIGIIFIGLLLVPGSPAQLTEPSIIFLIIWFLLGAVFYKHI